MSFAFVVPLRRRAIAGGMAAGLVLAGAVAIDAQPAFAATALSVTTTADVAANAGACGNTSITTPASPLSLREAVCLANNLGGTVTIAVPAGTYQLNNGELDPGVKSGQNLTISGAGAASTIINGQGLSRVLDVDQNVTGGMTTTFSNLTVTGGVDSGFGGAGIIAGSVDQANSDILNLNNVIVTDNHANGSAPTATNKPGGGVQFVGGQLNITNSTFSNNTSQSSQGAGVAYASEIAGTGLSITGSTFSGNNMTNTSSGTSVANGGALALRGSASTAFVISGSSFRNNTVAATSGPAIGAAIWQQSGLLTVTGTSFTANSATGGAGTPTGGAIGLNGGSATLHYDRFVGNTATSGQAVGLQNAATANATEDWWGCNGGPGTAGCDTVSGSPTISPRLVLTATASPATVVGPNASATITGALTTDSLGAAVGSANLTAFASLPVTFSDPPGDATVTTVAGAHSAGFSSGQASIDYHSNTTVGPDTDNVTFDNATVSTSVTVDQAPALTSANTAHFNVGTAGSFTVTSTGYPTAAITRTGTLPAGLTFTDNGDGTATLAGTATGSGGTFPIIVTANNGVNPNASQTLTVTVGSPPAFTSSTTATFVAATAGSFAITTSGIPTVSAITESGSLPSGITFTDNGNGTATLAGTPAAGSGGTYPVTLTATNGVSPNGSQALSIQVNQAPQVTTNPASQTVNPATSVTFTAAATGVPTPTVQWQRSTNGGASYTNVAGATSTSYTFTSAAGDNGTMYRAVFTNLVSTATTTAATLNVGTAPAFASSAATTFSVGTAGTFAVTTTGVPNATLTVTGSVPAWLTLTDHSDGTGTLSGTPPTGSGGIYSFTLHAANGFSPAASQTFTLSVDESPTITSTNHATFTVASAGSFAVTTTAGFPTTTKLTETGALPTGVTFTDNADGTATLAGTPSAGQAGTYALTFSAAATGSATAPSTQSFTLTVNGPPSLTSANHATFVVGSVGTFTVTTTAGLPTARTLAHTGTLPTGVTFTDNGDGTAAIAGTPAFGTGGTYALTIIASNGVAPDAAQLFTLTVNEPPTLTSLNHATFTVGTSEAFTVTTAGGQPSTDTLSESGALPTGVHFTDNGDGTATLAGMPAVGQGGTYALTITASNGVAPNPRQAFTLTVDGPPTITSSNHATFVVGTVGTFTVTTAAGTPTATTITSSSLPVGVTSSTTAMAPLPWPARRLKGQGGVYPITITASNSIAPDPHPAVHPDRQRTADHHQRGQATFTIATAAHVHCDHRPGQPNRPR